MAQADLAGQATHACNGDDEDADDDDDDDDGDDDDNDDDDDDDDGGDDNDDDDVHDYIYQDDNGDDDDDEDRDDDGDADLRDIGNAYGRGPTLPMAQEPPCDPCRPQECGLAPSLTCRAWH